MQRVTNFNCTIALAFSHLDPSRSQLFSLCSSIYIDQIFDSFCTNILAIFLPTNEYERASRKMHITLLLLIAEVEKILRVANFSKLE